MNTTERPEKDQAVLSRMIVAVDPAGKAGISVGTREAVSAGNATNATGAGRRGKRPGSLLHASAAGAG